MGYLAINSLLDIYIYIYIYNYEIIFHLLEQSLRLRDDRFATPYLMPLDTNINRRHFWQLFFIRCVVNLISFVYLDLNSFPSRLNDKNPK